MPSGEGAAAGEDTGRSATITVPIRSAADVVAARQEGRALAARFGFNGSDLTATSWNTPRRARSD
jgi:hypothetical protein